MVVAIRSPRGDGREAFALLTPLDSALALGVALAWARLASTAEGAPWLARDVLWVAADGGCGGGASEAAAAWLADYSGGGAPPGFLRGGALTGALVLESRGDGLESMELRVQGRHGALPNLDVVSLARTLSPVPLRLAGEEQAAAAGLPQHASALAAAARFLGRQARGEADGCASAICD